MVVRLAARRWAPWLLAGGTLVLGFAWRDCVLVAGSAMLALDGFYEDMDAGTPWEGWRAAIRCSIAGVASIVLAIAVASFVAGTVAGWWSPVAGHADGALAAVLGLAAVTAWLKSDRAFTRRGLALAVLAVLGAAAALVASRVGVRYAACVFASVTAAAVAWIGWHLTHDVAPRLAAAGRRH